MGRRIDEVVPAEPTPAPFFFVTGVRVVMENNHVVIISWVRLPETGEERIVFRFAMPHMTGRDMMAQLGLGIAKGDHS